MKKRVALIGLGIIAGNYHQGLTTSEIFDLVAVCDIDKNASCKEKYKDYRFYESYQEMLVSETLEYVCIATPPATHEEIATYFLNHKINVLMEKPATINYESYEKLISISKKNNVLLDTVFHWAYGSDIRFLKPRILSFGKIEAIKVNINDPYMDDQKHINNNKISLGGAWLDSGVNALSMLYALLDIEKIVYLDGKFLYDENCKLPYYASNDFLLNDSIITNITTSWQNKINKKYTTIVYDTGILSIYHTDQRIEFNGKEIYNNNSLPRLVDHYVNFFKYFDEKKVDLNKSLKTHEILFKANKEEK